MADEGGSRSDRIRIGSAEYFRLGGRQNVAISLSSHNVFRDTDECCPWAPGFSRPERVGDYFGNGIRRIHFSAEFGDWAEKADRVHALVDLLEAIGERHCASDRNHWVSFRIRSCEARHQVRAAWT